MHGPNRLNFDLNPYFIVVLLICKNQEDSIKNEGATVFTTLYMYIDFLDAQEQQTPLSVVGYCRNTNSYMYKLLCMSSLPARQE